MNKKVYYKNLGLIDYKEAWDCQEKLFQAILDTKSVNRKLEKSKQKDTDNYLLFCEHPHVYTLGKSGASANLLIDQIQLKAKNASFYEINRGGDITYHGPGQIVVYPIFNLEYFTDGIKDYINKLEEVIIRTLKDFNIKSERLAGATGVWLDTDIKGRNRKICAMGVRTSRWVSMHGFALNVNTNLEYFDYINPCGFTDKGVTSMEKELNAKVNIDEVKEKLRQYMSDVFGIETII